MTNYERGVKLERDIQHWYEYHQFYCMRSAGSHGLADLIVMFPSQMYMIQVKLHDKLRDEIREKELLALKTIPNVYKFTAWKIIRNRRKTASMHNIVTNEHSFITLLSDEQEAAYQRFKDAMKERYEEMKKFARTDKKKDVKRTRIPKLL